MTPGQQLTVVKLAPDGSEAARYPGAVMATRNPDAWVVVRAIWTFAAIDVAGLPFIPGDTLLEWFSPEHPFNAFAVLSPKAEPRGWYANVTRPAFLEPDRDQDDHQVLVWHDMYLDLVGLPNGEMHVLDEDELAASHLAETDPDRYAAVLKSIADLRVRFTRLQTPFASWTDLAAMARSWTPEGRPDSR